MMKVKPFSYHIPRRRKAYYDDGCCTSFNFVSKSPLITSHSSRSNSTSSISNGRTSNDRDAVSAIISQTAFSTPSSLFTLGGVGTVVILVLFGFLGVAGQGKLDEIHESRIGTFSSRALLSDKHSLSHENLDSLPSIRVLNTESTEDDDDDALQQRISLMGYYGTKYRNFTFPYNYSSHPPLNDFYISRQYKLEPHNIGELQSTPRENFLLSLRENEEYVPRAPPKSNTSEMDPENVINFQSIRQFKRPSEDKGSNKIIYDEGDENVDKGNPLPTVSDPPTPNKTSSVSPTQKSKYGKYLQADSPGKAMKPLGQYNNKDNNESSDEIDIDEDTRTGQPLFKGPQFATSDLDEYDDEDTLERFIPGNSSHSSGKLRFRQGSQAEVDSSDNENENSVRSRRRPRRSVVHLYDMVVCSTGCNPLIFKGYGCYCGFLGSGLTVDGIDKCCAKHDWCYHHAKCPPLLTYFVPYYWRCDHGRPQCVTDFRGWKGICGAHLCECDRQFAECLKKFPCPRSRAMCVTSPWSPMPADPRAFPFTVSRRQRPWRPPLPPFPFPPPLSGIPLLPYSPMGRFFQ